MIITISDAANTIIVLTLALCSQSIKLKSEGNYQNDMSREPTRITDDERRKLTRIPDNVETRDVLENLLFDLSLKGLLTDDNLHLIIHNR
jgi:hypothetical protein